ncbi:MAG TPA: VWA domain-containing protein [Terracidiphilus sp.]|nr:VWA domain-containing protein [Terracidiphilus sp.]
MRNKPVLLLALSGLALSCLPVAARAQQAAQGATDKPVATLKVQAREVLLPVTVRDKHGALVPNLTVADFTLAEDGRPQVIKSFTHESNLPFRLGLLVDTSRSVSAAMENEKKAAGKFIDLMLPANSKGATAGDAAFLIHFDREVELLQDFTSSRDNMHRELDTMGPTERERNTSNGPETSGDDRGSQSRGNRGGTQLYDAIFLAADDLMKPKEGRKALVVFSDGEDRGSKENLNDAIDAADHANLAVYTIYFKGQQERGANEGFPGGGGRRGGDRQSDIDGRKIMEKIATRTGGRFFEAKKKDNLEDIYNQIAEELRGQYLLSYTPDKPDNDEEFHKIALKAKNADLAVSTREGYYSAEK